MFPYVPDREHGIRSPQDPKASHSLKYEAFFEYVQNQQNVYYHKRECNRQNTLEPANHGE